MGYNIIVKGDVMRIIKSKSYLRDYKKLIKDPKDIQSGKTPEELCLADFANKLHLEDKYRSCLRLIGITDLVSNKAPEEEQKRNNSVNGVMWYKQLQQQLQDWYQTPHDINAKSNLASVASGTSDEA